MQMLDPTSASGAALTVVCQGASFTAIPAANPPRLRSPCAELWLDGCKVGCTRRHDRGDRQPRWDERFSLSATGRKFTFRVFVGNAPDEQLCGEGHTDLQALLANPSDGPRSVSLALRGEATGIIWFTLGLMNPADGAPGGNTQEPAFRAGMQGQAAVSNPWGGGAYAAGAGTVAGNQARVGGGATPPPPFRQGPFTPLTPPGQPPGPSAYPQGNQVRLPQGALSQVPLGQFPMPHLWDNTPMPTPSRTQPPSQRQSQQGEPGAASPRQAQRPPESLPISGARTEGHPGNSREAQCPPPPMQLTRAKTAPLAAPSQQAEKSPRSAIAFAESPDRSGGPGDVRRTKSPRSLGGVSPRSLRRLTVPAAPGCISPKNPLASNDSKNSKSSQSSGGGRLNIGDHGRQSLNEVMSSKDKMAYFAQRPFDRKQPDAGLSFEEFAEALIGILRELQVSEPGDGQLQQLYNKHQRDGKGLGREAFEMLLFRLLSFMRASQEVSVTKEPKTPGGARDKRWREEFLQRNPRNFVEVYEQTKMLGKGTFGSVYKVAHKTQRRGKKNERCLRVCKIISKATVAKAGTTDATVREELAVLKKLDHPHVLRIFEDFEDDENFYLIMEPCWGGDLQECVKTLEISDAREYEKWVAKVMHHSFAALGYCHQKGVIHKDLKPENIMLSTDKDVPMEEMHVVIVDFGLSEVFSKPGDRSNIVSGTPPFMAPEVWAGSFDKACDIWSCGVMLFFLLSGRLPFMASRVEEFPPLVNHTVPDWTKMGGASPEAHALCRKMLEKRACNRLSAAAALNDRWFAAMGLDTRSTQKLAKPQLDALLKVPDRGEFEKFITRLVATQVDASKFRIVNEAFAAFDTDGDGQLSKEELSNGLQRARASTANVDQVFEELDMGSTGFISYTEFLAGTINLSGKKTEEQDNFLWVAWQQFSPDQNGRVNHTAVQDALSSRGMTVADLPERFLEELGRGASGELTFESFKKLLVTDAKPSMIERLAGENSRAARFTRWLMQK